LQLQQRRTKVVEDLVSRRTAELAAAKFAANEERYRAFITQSAEPIWRAEQAKPVSLLLPIEDQVARYFRPCLHRRVQ